MKRSGPVRGRVVSEVRLLRRLRAACLRLPGTDEAKTWGHPTFRADGRAFAVLEVWRGRLCLVFKATRGEQQRLVRGGRFFAAPYVGKHGWVSMPVAPPMRWSEVSRLLLRSHGLIARDGPRPGR